MAGNVTRRNFFKLATDTLFALPVVAGGFLAIDPEEAWADDVPYESDIDGGTYGAGTEVIAVNPYETGFLVVDMSDGGKQRVAGAKVIVTSRFNKKKVEGVTDSQGSVVLNISELAENPDKLPKLDTFAFNGSIEVIIDSGGYRDFKVSLTRVEGGRGYRLPSRKITDDKPYPVSVSFDDWDILYTGDLVFNDDVPDVSDPNHQQGIRYFGLSPENTDLHTFAVLMKNFPSGSAQATMQLVEHDSGKAIFTQDVTANNGVAELKVTKRFLEHGAADALPEKKSFDVWVTLNNVKYTFPVRLQAEKTIFPRPAIVTGKLAKPLVTKGNAMGTSGFSKKLPALFPLGKNDEFKMWLPDFPVNISVDPTGYFQLTMRTPGWGYVNDYGKPEENGWKSFPRDAVTKQIKKKKESWDKTLSKAKNAYSGKSGLARQVDFSSTFKCQGFFQFMAVAAWDLDKGEFSGNAVGQFTLAMDYALAETFLAGPIPILVQFGFKLNTTFSLGPGFTVTPKSKNLLDNVTDLSLYKWDYTNTGLTLTIIFAPFLSIGVGLKGIASVSLRGTFTLSFFCGITMRPDDRLESPHLIVGYKYGASIVAEFFLWSHEWDLFSGGDSDWFNNWKTGGASGQADESAILDPLADMTLEEFLKGMKPVTDDMLTSTAEFRDNKPITAQEEDGPVIVLDAQYTEEPKMEDGTPIPTFIYTLKADGQETPQDSAAAPTEDAAEAGVETLGLDAAAEGGEEAVADAVSDVIVAEGEQLEAVAESMVAQSEDAAVAEAVAGAAMGLVAMDEESGETYDAYVEGEGVEEPAAEEAGDYVEPSESEEPAAEEPAPEAEQAPGEGESAEAQPEDFDVANSPFSYSIPSYEQIYDAAADDAGGLVAMADAAPGVAGLGDEGGIRLTTDIAFLKDVFGNPRVEVVDIQGTTYVLRIASVLVNGKPRTRLIATVISGYRLPGTSQVLDFKITSAIDGVSRDDLCDYEFAAKVDNSGYHLQVAFISGKRNTQDFGSAATDLVLSFVLFGHHQEKGFDSVIHSVNWSGNKVFANTGEYPYHCISNLELSQDIVSLPREGESYRTAGYMSTIAYLDRMGRTPQDVMSEKAAKARLGIVLVPQGVTGWSEPKFVVPDPAVIESKVGTFEDLTAYELRLWGISSDWYTFMIRGASQTRYYVMNLGGTLTNPNINSVKHVVTLDDRCCFHLWKHEATTGLGHWMPRYLNCNEKGELCTSIITYPWEEKPHFSMTRIGPEDFGIISFGVWGDFIYWPEARDGAGGQTADPETGEVIEMPPLNDCHLMAARYYNNEFSDTFIMADLPHNIDALVNISGDSKVLKVVASELTDRKKDMATIWCMAVPFVKSVTATHCVPVNPFVSPGKPARFYLTIRNDGNTFLKGCEAAMYDKSASLETPVATAKVTFSMDTIRESAWNPKGDDGKLQHVMSDGALAPGKTSVYLMEIMIPDGWSGRKDICFITRNSEVVSGMTGAADEEGEEEYEIVDYCVDPKDGVSDFVLADEKYWEEAFYDDAPVSVYGVDETPGGTSGGSSSGGAGGGKTGTNSKKGTDSKKGLPKMGDTTNPSAIAGMAAAGAALAAAGAYAKMQEDDE